jgi:hypothetical protein
MRGFETKPDGVVARVRARLSALMRRLRTRIHPGEAAAFEKAAREAFRASMTPEARKPSRPETHKPFAPVPSSESPGTVSGAVRPAGTVVAPTAPPAATVIESVQEAPAAGPPGREPRRHAGDTAPDFLLRTPRTTPVADDFFDGLIRRVEGDR